MDLAQNCSDSIGTKQGNLIFKKKLAAAPVDQPGMQAPWHEQDLSAEQTGAITAALQKAVVDPTLTVSSKEAFEALGAAFAGRLGHEQTRCNFPAPACSPSKFYL